MAAPAPLRPSCPAFIWLCRCLALLILTVAAQAAPKWDPVNKDELAETKGKVDPEADAEILLLEAHLVHTYEQTIYDRYYVRIKIFSQKGVEDFKKIEREQDKDSRVFDIEARTIKPDGTVVNLNPQEVSRSVRKESEDIGDTTVSFAPPGVVPGSIIEYRYRFEGNYWGENIITIMPFQAPHPQRIVRYIVEPIRNLPIRTVSYNCPEQKLKPDRNGVHTFEMHDLPAANEEPFEDSKINSRRYILLYAHKPRNTADENWKLLGDSAYALHDSAAKVTKTIQAALAEIVKPDDPDLEKLKKIYDFCRSKIINRDSKTSGLTQQQLDDLSKNPHAADTLKAGSGTRADINILFAALARAAGLETRPALCNDRTFLQFHANLPELGNLLLDDAAVAVRVKSEWYFFNPGARYLPFGMLPWKNTNTTALICGDKFNSEFKTIPGEPAEKSKIERKGTFTLNADGTLEGDVTETYSGYRESDLKLKLEGKTPSEIETYVAESIQNHQKLAEVTAIVVENATDPLGTLKYSYHLRIPDYAQRTGDRIIFQPGVFQKGNPPLFEAATRRSDICFDYRQITRDDLRITPPEGYVLEEASAPKDLDLGPLGKHTVNIGLSRKTRAIVFQRQFSLNGLTFDKKIYDVIKAAFEALHKADSHVLTLKRTEPTPPLSAPVPTPAAQSEKRD